MYINICRQMLTLASASVTYTLCTGLKRNQSINQPRKETRKHQYNAGLIWPFKVFSVFYITLACESLTGRQGVNKKTEKKKVDSLGKYWLKNFHFESCLILSSFLVCLNLQCIHLDSKLILAQKSTMEIRF